MAEGLRYRHEAEELTQANGMPADYVPNSQRVCRASGDYWDRMLRFRPVGYAPNIELSRGSEPSVLVYYPATCYLPEVRLVSSFRRRRTNTRTRTRAELSAETEARLAERQARLDAGSDVAYMSEVVGTADYLASDAN